MWAFVCGSAWRVGSGVGSAVDGEIGSGDVGRLGAGDEGYQGGDLVCCAVAFEGGDGFLRGCPFACGGIEIGVDGARLDVVDGDAAAADFSGQALGEHLHGSLGGGVGGQAGSHHTFADTGADHNDPAVVVHVLERGLGRDHQAAEV